MTWEAGNPRLNSAPSESREFLYPRKKAKTSLPVGLPDCQGGALPLLFEAVLEMVWHLGYLFRNALQDPFEQETASITQLYRSHFGSSHFGSRLKLAPSACLRCHFGLWMERAVLDWQELTLDGFTDGTHVQLTVAGWLRLGGGVERKLEEPAPGQPDTRHISDYSYYTDSEEVEVELVKGLLQQGCRGADHLYPVEAKTNNKTENKHHCWLRRPTGADAEQATGPAERCKNAGQELPKPGSTPPTSPRATTEPGLQPVFEKE